jgi:drug/metabolite transporter (DMT)-like permease
LIAPATASLTYIGNAVVARTFLHENVDRRRWISVALVTVGIFLIAG